MPAPAASGIAEKRAEERIWDRYTHQIEKRRTERSCWDRYNILRGGGRPVFHLLGIGRKGHAVQGQQTFGVLVVDTKKLVFNHGFVQLFRSNLEIQFRQLPVRRGASLLVFVEARLQRDMGSRDLFAPDMYVSDR